jgi:pimeloyl-ACP methyl ester carboxylesterase
MGWRETGRGSAGKVFGYDDAMGRISVFDGDAFMRRVWRATVALFAVLLLAGAGVMTIGAAQAAPQANGKVYLLRGGANIFSTGMDDLARKLRSKGIDAASYGHADWPKLAIEARQRYAKDKSATVIIGHSFGANAAVVMASELEKSNTPVALIILYDPTDNLAVPGNVRRVVKFNSSTAIGLGLKTSGTVSFHGSIDNVDTPQFNHLDMDNAAPLQDRSIAEVLKIIRPKLRASLN